MVYRVQPARRRRAVFFLYAFAAAFLLLSPLLLMLLELVWALLLVLPLLAALFAWLILRQWERLDWFTPEPPAYFLTMVDEGLLLEIPARGFSLYMPWRYVQYRHLGNVLHLVYRAVPVAVLSLRGVSRARREEILSRLYFFTRQKSASPLADSRHVSGLPLIPRPSVLPPPRPVAEVTHAAYSNTSEQWLQAVRFLSRPGRVVCGVFFALIAALGFLAGYVATLAFTATELTLIECLNLLFGCFLVLCGAFYLLVKLALSGRSDRLRIPGPVWLSFTRSEVIEQMELGAWSRSRLPSPHDEPLVYLRDCRFLWLGEGRILLLDAGADLPPALEPYTPSPAPGNRLRVVLASLVLALGMLAGYGYTLLPSEAELAFRRLPATPDAAALRQFAAHYANGQVLGTPTLVACPLDPEDEESEAGYMLCLTDSEPDPDDDDGSFHLAWETCVLLHSSGKPSGKGTWPVDWCPCEDWLNGPPDWLCGEEEDEDNDTP